MLPQSLKTLLLSLLHSATDHQGKERTLDLLHNRFYWPSLSRYVVVFQCMCILCN